MALFKLPTREPTNTKVLIDKSKEISEMKNRVKLKGTSLSAQLEAIAIKVEKTLGNVKDDYLLITKDEDFVKYCEQAVKDGIVAIDSECAGIEYSEMAQIAGICIYSPSQKEAYAPIGHLSSITDYILPNQITKEGARRGIEILKQNNVKIVFHNAYFDLIVIKLCTDVWLDVYWDTLPAAFLLNENEPHGLKYLYDKYVMDGSAGVHKFSEIFGHEIPINFIPPKIAGVYAAHDALMTYKLYEFQKEYLIVGSEGCTECKLEGVSNVFFTEELPIIPILAEMKYRGLKLDINNANKLEIKYEALRKDAENKFNIAISVLKDKIMDRATIYGDIEYPINYNSPSQIKVLIYDILNTGVIFKKEPSGTGMHVLSTVMSENKYKNTILYEIVKNLIEVKKYDKALNTFIIKLKELAIRNGGIVRPNFNSVSARTGRLSSSGELNVQQLPSKLGDIRTMFTAGDGRVYISADIKKQEVVVASIISGDTKLQEALKSGLDIYSQIASVAYKNKYEDNLEFFPDGSTNKEGKKRRSACKAVVLGCLYSKGVKSISEDLHISVEDAQEVYDAVMDAFPQLANWILETQERAKKDGYVEGMFGRRRRLPDLQLPPYEFTYMIDVDEKTKMYYNDLYTKRLDKTFRQEDKQKIVAEAYGKGINIKQNGGFIAKAQRECVNSCVTYDTTIITKQFGIKQIGELTDCGEFDVFDGDSFVHCDGVIASGLKQKYIITFNDGSIVECSPEHRFLYMNTRSNVRFLTTEELAKKVEDNNNHPMIISQDTPALFKSSRLPLPFEKSKAYNAIDYTFDSVEDDFELGYLLGWLQGDGYLHLQKGRGFSTTWFVFENKYNAKDFIYKVLSKYFRVTVKEVSAEWMRQHGKPHATESFVKYTVYSTSLTKQAKLMGIKSKVPNIVFSSSEIARGYIAGLFDTDGGFSGGSAQITFGRVHEQENIAREVQTLLFSFGVHSYISLLKDRVRLTIKALHNQRYGNIIGSLISRKQRGFEINKEQRTTTFKYANTKRVRSIERADEFVPMYDVINSDTHKFVANGVVTHNCVQGSSADICKRIIIAIGNNKSLMDMDCKLEMSIHDEQIVSCPKEHAWKVCEILRKITEESTGDTPVKLEIDTAITDVWYGEEYKFNENHELEKE